MELKEKMLAEQDHSKSGGGTSVKTIHEAFVKATMNTPVKLIKELVGMLKEKEWEIHHAAENDYCPFCVNDEEYWEDQKEHHKGCKYVKLMKKARNFLNVHNSNGT